MTIYSCSYFCCHIIVCIAPLYPLFSTESPYCISYMRHCTLIGPCLPIHSSKFSRNQPKVNHPAGSHTRENVKIKGDGKFLAEYQMQALFG